MNTTTIAIVNLAEIIVWTAFGLAGLFSLLFASLFVSFPSLPNLPFPSFLVSPACSSGIHLVTLWSGVLKTLTESHGKQFADELALLSVGPETNKSLDHSFKKEVEDTSGVYEIIRLVSSGAKDDGVVLGLRRV